MIMSCGDESSAGLAAARGPSPYWRFGAALLRDAGPLRRTRPVVMDLYGISSLGAACSVHIVTA